MVSDTIYQGIHIFMPGLKYLYVKEGSSTRILKDNGTYTLEFTSGMTNKQVASSLGLEFVGAEKELTGMSKSSKLPDITFSLNGLKFRRLTFDSHIIKVIIVSDSDSRIVQNYQGTTIVVAQKDVSDQEFLEYIFYSGNLLYIQPIGSKKCLSGYTIKNFPFLSVSKSISYTSDSDTVYVLRHRYDDYRIRSIDYQEQFFAELGKILEAYGIELVRMNREKTLTTTAYVSYRISQTPVKANHPMYSDLDNGVLQHRVPIDFELRCTNMQMFYDFKNRYNNVDLLTNFCEFRTSDKYGERWTASVKWGQITEDFSHMYDQDNNSNFSYQCSFRCELFFFEVYDKIGDILKDICIEIDND